MSTSLEELTLQLVTVQEWTVGLLQAPTQQAPAPDEHLSANSACLNRLLFTPVTLLITRMELRARNRCDIPVVLLPRRGQRVPAQVI